MVKTVELAHCTVKLWLTQLSLLLLLLLLLLPALLLRCS